jgi:hypothetical protein
MKPSKNDIQRRIDEVEAEVDDIQPLTFSHLIDEDDEHGFEPVDESRGIWYSTLTDDLRLGPTKEEIEDAGGFLDALITDEAEP